MAEDKQDIRDRVQEVLDTVRPSLQADGGDVELVNVKNGAVLLRLQGHCRGCPMSQMTLAMVIERTLKEQIPEVERVVAVD
ncbi:NifU family protein [bacterium]|nr:NifU family protein [bacterium]